MPYKPIDRARLESLARSWTTTALKTLAGIMTNTSAKDRDRIRAAEVILDHGRGMGVSAHMTEKRITSLALEVVHLAPVTREEFADDEPLQVEWHEVKKAAGNGDDRQ
jgi:hypothetical protein